MKKSLLILFLLFLIPVFIFAVDSVRIVANNEADAVRIENQKIDVSTVSAFQYIASGTYIANASAAFTTENQIGIFFATNVSVLQGGNLGVGTDRPTSFIDVFGGSLTIRGANAGLKVHGNIEIDSATIRGVLTSTNGIRVKEVTFGDGTTQTTAGGGGGDNLGSHVATQALNMNQFQILRVSSLTVTGNMEVSSSNVKGVLWSTNSVTAKSYFYGDGTEQTTANAGTQSSFSGSLATGTLNMGGFQILQISSLSVVGNAVVSSLTVQGVLTTTNTSIFQDISMSSFAVRSGTVSINGVKYIYPPADGSNGQVLKTNASGVLSWSADDNTGGAGSSLAGSLATGTLNMGGFQILQVSSFSVVGNAVVSSLTVQGVLTTTNTATFQDISMSSFAVRSGTASFNGVKYIYPPADGSNGQVLKTNASGVLTWSADNNTGGTTNAETTYTIKMAGGGDVFLATSSFSPITGSMFVAGFTTWTVINVQGFIGAKTSTVGSTFFNLAISTDTGASSNWVYVLPQIEVATNTHYSTWVSTSFVINSNNRIALHTTGVPGVVVGGSGDIVGTPPVEYGLLIRARRPDEK